MKNKVREIIEISGWLENEGVQYTETYADRITEIDAGFLSPETKYDWSWWKPEILPENEDLIITVKYYPADCDLLFDDAGPIISFEVWQSDLTAKQRV